MEDARGAAADGVVQVDQRGIVELVVDLVDSVDHPAGQADAVLTTDARAVIAAGIVVAAGVKVPEQGFAADQKGVGAVVGVELERVVDVQDAVVVGVVVRSRRRAWLQNNNLALGSFQNEHGAGADAVAAGNALVTEGSDVKSLATDVDRLGVGDASTGLGTIGGDLEQGNVAVERDNREVLGVRATVPNPVSGVLGQTVGGAVNTIQRTIGTLLESGGLVRGGCDPDTFLRVDVATCDGVPVSWEVVE